MQILYRCRTAKDGWTFPKFDDDMNVEIVYTVTVKDNQTICDCPGWPRKNICKHTRMLATFAKSGAIDGRQFFCYETQTWHQPIAGPWDQDDPTARKAAEHMAEGPSSEPLPEPTPPPKSSIRRV